MQSSRTKHSLDQLTSPKNTSSIKNSTSTPIIQFEANKITTYSFRKSIFSPSQETRKQFAFRAELENKNRQILGFEVIFNTGRWLLIRCNRVSPTFFSRLKLENWYVSILRKIESVFIAMSELAKIYGFFKITNKMIFEDQVGKIKVWFNEDIFSNKKMISIEAGQKSQEIFVNFFEDVLKQNMEKWKRTDVKSIQDFISSLQERILTIQNRNKFIQKISHGMHAKTHRPLPSRSNSAEFQFFSAKTHTNQSLHKFFEEGDESDERIDCFHPKIDNSVVINQELQISVQNSDQNKLKNLKEFYCKQLKESVYDKQEPAIEQSNEITVSRKNLFPLTSTSSTLQKFCERGKYGISSSTQQRSFSNLKIPSPHDEKRMSYLSSGLIREISSQKIQTELEDLFKADEDQVHLEKIAQEMQQVLLW